MINSAILFNEDMRQFVFSRTECIVMQEVSPEYREISKRLTELFHKLLRMLPEEGKELLKELDSLSVTIEGLEQAIFYNLGFSDGMRLVMQNLDGGVLR